MPERLENAGWIQVAVQDGARLAARIAAAVEASDPTSDLVLLRAGLEFPDAEWLERLRACAHSAPRVGIVGCRLALPGGKLLHAGAYVLPDTYWVQAIGHLEKNVRQFASGREVEEVFLSGAYIRREVLDAVGTPSEELDFGFLDADYCLRARAAGFQVRYRWRVGRDCHSAQPATSELTIRYLT